MKNNRPKKKKNSYKNKKQQIQKQPKLIKMRWLNFSDIGWQIKMLEKLGQVYL